MRRRAFVMLGGTVLFAGCSSTTSSDATTTELRPHETETTGASRTDETETSRNTGATETPRLAVEDEYSFGEWHDLNDWAVTVRSLDLTTTFRVDDAERTFEMPDDQQLAIATVEVKNDSTRRGWSAPFGFVVDGTTVYETQMSFDHPEFTHEVDIRQLERVEHQHQFQPEGLPVDAGETERLWAVAVVPRLVSRQRVQVGLEVGPDDVLYPVRWTLA